MRGFLLFAVAFFFFISAPVHAQSSQTCQGQTIPVIAGQLLCSKTFYATGTCDGQDDLAKLTANGQSTTMVQPWEPVPITIVGYQIALVEGALQYAFGGNSYTPDVMGWLGSTESSHGAFYPTGTGFAFPAAGADVHLDLHYNCRANSFQAFYTVFYTVVSDQAVAATH